MVGIGGAGMSGIARLAAEIGYAVSGTDREESAALAALRGAGVDARAGHSAAALPPGAEALVISSAVPEENPERREAAARGLPELHRSELLAELMGARRGIAVAGAHGKSTTSGMLAVILDDPSVCVGAVIAGGDGTGARWGDDPWFISEADESDRSLLNLRPEAAVLLNVDLDHHTEYADVDAVADVFASFLAALPAEGVVVAGPDERAWSLAREAPCAARLVGPGPGSFCEPTEIDAGGFTMAFTDGRRQRVRLAVPGRHNVDNACAALAMADWCGVDPAVAAERLAGFTGVGRRFEIRGSAAGITVVDDYAHHPAEVRATLAAARERAAGRVVVVFQPHLYSRTRALGADFARELGAADVVVVTGVYAAREPHDPDVSGRDIAGAIAGADATYVERLDDVPERLVPGLRRGDLVLTMGAGDVTRLGGDLVSEVERRMDGGESRSDDTS